MVPKVSIVILNYFHPEYINICLRSLAITEMVEYEVIVVDNGSDERGKKLLEYFKENEMIDKIVGDGETNHLFSEGNNMGVRAASADSDWFLLLNSDVAFLRLDWLRKLFEFVEGTPQTFRPSIWGQKPTEVKPGRRDIISCGWSHDANVYGNARPEGWCLLISRAAWREIDTGFPWLYGMDKMVTDAVRDGFRCGVLSQYAPFLVHREGGSGKVPDGFYSNREAPDLPGWYSGVEIETLDFTLGPDEHSSYMWWD